MRVQEAASLELKHIRLAEGNVFIQGKGAKERRLPLVGLAAAIVEAQIGELGDLAHQTRWLFPQRTDPEKHITDSSISHAAVRAARAAGMEQLTAHDLRRTCATGLRALGTDRDVVSLILGHTQHDVTATYVRADLRTEQREALTRWSDRVQSEGTF